jgi:hypothetical protein
MPRFYSNYSIVLMRCAVKSASEGFQGMGVPHKLMSEERLMFDFIENLNEIVKKN